MSEAFDPRFGSRRGVLNGVIAATFVSLVADVSRAASVVSADRVDVKHAALILLDFQRSSDVPALKPFSFDAAIGGAAIAAATMRARGGLVIHTRVLVEQMLDLPADKALPAMPPVADATALDPRLEPRPGEPIVSKRQWGAFYGTDLDQILRRRGITTLLLAGVATEAAVESTARAAYDAGYDLIFVRDAITGISDESYGTFMDTLFPLMGRVRSSARLAAMMTGASAAGLDRHDR